MNASRLTGLQTRTGGGGALSWLPDGAVRLALPTGTGKTYRLAQLDDYSGLRREQFRWETGVEVALELRASQAQIPGTWGFGLWNDPFSVSLGLGGASQRLPALPQTAWFFWAAPENHLALDDSQAGSGALAAVFNSERLPAGLLGLAALALPLVVVRPLSRILRRTARRVIRQASAQMAHDPTEWQRYSLTWQAAGVRLAVNGMTVLETGVSPVGRLGLVVWIDNQYAAWRPDGSLGYGTLPNPAPVWIEARELQIGRAI